MNPHPHIGEYSSIREYLISILKNTGIATWQRVNRSDQVMGAAAVLVAYTRLPRYSMIASTRYWQIVPDGKVYLSVNLKFECSGVLVLSVRR